MPELPEVETVKKTLEKLVIGKTIEAVSVHCPRIIREPGVESFCEQLIGKQIQGMDRRGKFLKFYCDPWVLVSHLRMEGKYRVVQKAHPVEKHTHIIFHFTDDTELRYLDVRQFGTMDLLLRGEEENSFPLNKLGPEPLSDAFTTDWLSSEMKSRKSKIKSLLLKQEWLAGLGNIYVDETLFLSGIHPERSAHSLTQQEISALHFHIQDVLKKAIEAGGSSVRSYRNGEGGQGEFQLSIQVYGRKNEPCFRCGDPIRRLVVAGRGTHLCLTCQPFQ